MSRHTVLVVLIVVGVVVFSYEVGKLTGIAPDVQPSPKGVAAPEAPFIEPSIAPTKLDKDAVQEIADIPFDVTYRTLRSASHGDLVIWLKNLKEMSPRARAAALSSFFKVLIQFDPGLARQLIEGLDAGDRWFAMLAVKRAAPPRAMPEVAEVLVNFFAGDIGLDPEYLRYVVNEWSTLDPEAVQRFLDRQPRKRVAECLPVLLHNWAAYDPSAARAWMMQKIDESSTKRESDDEDTADDRKTKRSELIASWLEGFMENDRNAALDYLTQNRKEVAEVMSTVSAALFNESPSQARHLILALSATEQSSVLANIGFATEEHAYGDRDDSIRSPEFVARWMLEFSGGVWQEAISPVLRRWSDKDSESLFAWMAQLPQDVKEKVAMAYPFQPYGNPIEDQLATIGAIPDAQLRNQLLSNLMVKGGYNRDESVDALNKSALPPDQKAYYASLIPSNDPDISETEPVGR